MASRQSVCLPEMAGVAAIMVGIHTDWLRKVYFDQLEPMPYKLLPVLNITLVSGIHENVDWVQKSRNLHTRLGDKGFEGHCGTIGGFIHVCLGKMIHWSTNSGNPFISVAIILHLCSFI